jgi:hypothetical protein
MAFAGAAHMVRGNAQMVRNMCVFALKREVEGNAAKVKNDCLDARFHSLIFMKSFAA